jgi:hypothetical protein
MIYDFSLRTVGLVIGVSLIVLHVFALLQPGIVKAWLPTFPRSRVWGVILCTTAAVWAFWLAATMDLGEFTPNRTLICGVIIAGAIMVPLFAEEFLAARAIGMLALLAAEPLLGASFLKPEHSRLLLVVLAYVWAIAGLLLVGAPYLLRDLIGWLLAARVRYLAGACTGVLYGMTLVTVSWLFFRS